MFEVGKEYEFRVIEAGDDIIFRGIVEKYEHPLLKLADSPPVTVMMGGEVQIQAPSYPGRIINVISPYFATAVELL